MVSAQCALYQLHLTSVDTVAPIEREIRNLANGLTAVKDEQEYIVIRERRHRNTAESTNSRVKWWSIFQAIVLVSVVAWQVYYLKACHILIHILSVLIKPSSRSSRSSARFRVYLALDMLRVNCGSNDESYAYVVPGQSVLRGLYVTLCRTPFHQESIRPRVLGIEVE